jgi:hypothetical protein
MMGMNDEKETIHTITKCIRDETMNISKEEQTTPQTTPRLEIASNDVKMTILEIGFV